MTNKKIQVRAECDACRGTGLYSGFAEAKGEAVLCLGCNGTGGVFLTFIPFTERHGRKDIKTVRRSRGSHLATGVGATGVGITYAEFQSGKRP